MCKTNQKTDSITNAGQEPQKQRVIDAIDKATLKINASTNGILFGKEKWILSMLMLAVLIITVCAGYILGFFDKTVLIIFIMFCIIIELSIWLYCMKSLNKRCAECQEERKAWQMKVMDMYLAIADIELKRYKSACENESKAELLELAKETQEKLEKNIEEEIVNQIRKNTKVEFCVKLKE